MTKEKSSAAFPGVRSILGGLTVRSLAVLALAAVSAGCMTNRVSNFTPKSGMVCDEVRITGSFHKLGHLDGVWFNGVPANASIQHDPASGGRLTVVAAVPEGASTGPIRVRISTEGEAALWAKGVDYTFEDNFTVTGSPPAPVINSFSARPETIKQGQTATLQWQVSTGITKLTLNGADVSGTNSTSVSPTATTFYELVAKSGSCLQRSQTLTVTVLPSPKITSLGSRTYRPGEMLVLNGEGLARENESSEIVFSQGTTRITLKAERASTGQLAVAVPENLVRGPVVVQATVGSDASNTNRFNLDASTDGPFVDVKSRIGFVRQTCAGKELQVSTNVLGQAQPGRAVFRDGDVVLAQVPFTPGMIGGATFSPGGDDGVTVTADANGFSASYIDMIERFASHYRYQFPVNIMDGFKAATNRWHVLFSPDDAIVIVSSVPVGSSHMIAIQIHDLAHQRNIGPLIQIACTTGNVQGEVIGGDTVELKLDGAILGRFAIYPAAGKSKSGQ